MMKVSRSHRVELRTLYEARKDEIAERLKEFTRVPPERYFYELVFCLMTPQSSAAHCFAAAEALERAGFRERDIDPEPFLAPGETGYVRFHKTKAKRLVEMKQRYGEIHMLLTSRMPEKEMRSGLVRLVKGIGLKEASHFLRNTGRLDVTIIDRHIIRNFLRLGVLTEQPQSISPKRYLELEALFEELASAVSIPPPDLDLLLWSRETGFILK